MENIIEHVIKPPMERGETLQERWRLRRGVGSILNKYLPETYRAQALAEGATRIAQIKNGIALAVATHDVEKGARYWAKELQRYVTCIYFSQVILVVC